MTERNDFLKSPIFFERNRVFRVYTGGMPYRDFFADENGYDDGTDNFFPEEWVASEVKAFNQKTFGERDGVSVVKERGSFFVACTAAVDAAGGVVVGGFWGWKLPCCGCSF